jgi:hypothetical protein
MPLPERDQQAFAIERQNRMRQCIPDDFFNEHLAKCPPFDLEMGPPLEAIYWNYITEINVPEREPSSL